MPASQTPEPGTERTLRSSTARNPRRRQRQSDVDSLKTAPRRKRSKLSEETYAPRPSIERPEEAEEAVHNVLGNGHPRGSLGTRGRGRKESTPVYDLDLPVRGGRKTGTLKHRPLKGDGATVLTQNKLYSVKLLPSTPKELRKEGLEYRGSVLAPAHQHLALAVTREKAYVWDYNAHTTVSNARVFDVPFPARASETLPFGALVPGTAGADVGLVLISATSGRVTFYESIERAASLGLFQERRAGVEGTITGFSLTESVVDVTPAEHAGFILTLSSGRIIQLTLRDAQGKARIFTQPLRAEDSNTGIFGSIKGWYAGSWKRDVAAVRTRALDTRGQMQVMSVTERCELQIWDVDWTGRYDFKATVDFRAALADEMKNFLAAELHGSIDSLTALDFVIADKDPAAKGNEIATIGAERPAQLWLLLCTGPPNSRDYYLAQLHMVADNIKIARLSSIESYRATAATVRPRLLVPGPGHTVYITFGDALVLAAVPGQDTPDDPNAQLHEASYVAPDSFEDAVYLQGDRSLTVLDAASEDSRNGHSSILAFIKSAGLVRLIANDPSVDVERSQLPVKSKIEQALFFGAMQDNILDFTQRTDNAYGVEEVETAALDVSNEILCSTSAHISTSPTAMDAHLDSKAKALRALIAHIRRSYQALSLPGLWQLLWDAEKVAAAQAIWKVYDSNRSAGPERPANALDRLCEYFEAVKDQSQRANAVDEDLVRATLIHDLANIDTLLVQTRRMLEDLMKNKSDPPEEVLQYVLEIGEVWATALETVYAFRAENAHVYGIEADFVEDGVLSKSSDYAGLPGFWTSSDDMLRCSRRIPTYSRDLAKSHYETDVVPSDLIKQVTDANPGLIHICCLACQERIKFMAARPSQLDQQTAQDLQQSYNHERHVQFRALASIGAAEAGMQLAEKYRDMQTLTELVVGETQYYEDELEANPHMTVAEREVCDEMMNQMTERIGRYFEKFGEEWANAFFDEALSGSRAGEMLGEAQEKWKQALTRYLRADPSRAKICWINDITTVEDYTQAGVVLNDLAVGRETHTWAKKVEASMSKLALLAAQEGLSQPDQNLEVAVAQPERELRLVGIQARLYGHVASQGANALDKEAEMNLVMESLGNDSSRLSSLQYLLRTLLERVLQHDVLSLDELIDALTLMNTLILDDHERPDTNLDGAEFFLALQALDAAASTLEQSHFELLLQLIWKRCYTHDDWKPIIAAHKKKGNAESQTMLRDTAAWRTIHKLHDKALLAQPECNIRILEPSECLDAGCRAEHLAHRFSDRDLLDPILADNVMQDETLQNLVADHALDDWIKRCEADAKSAVEADVEEKAYWNEKERELAKVVGTVGKKTTKANGHVNGVVKKSGQAEQVMDGDGDVSMG
ncbi:hypothetical protein LTR86_001035 [Recurvomyces mirabilis]|nr:hypothetical protein LTR86_001035 [Recurvomyces mirabilis]